MAEKSTSYEHGTTALARHEDDRAREARYREVLIRLEALLAEPNDWVAAMATVACELHHAFAYYHWTGFYRVRGEGLIVGPYQGGHGCLHIAQGRGVCGAAAATRTSQRVGDVRRFPGHIACSASTRSELVVPVLSEAGDVIAVLDVDSDDDDAFREVDQVWLETLCARLGARYGAARER